MRPNVASAGAVMSIGSSATNTRPSGAAQTTEGCLTAGATATSSSRQFGSVLGISAAQALRLDKASTRKNADGKHEILISPSPASVAFCVNVFTRRRYV